MARTLINKAMLCGGLLAASTAWAGGASPEMLANTCVGCHGPDGASVGPASPSIAGLSKNYFVGAMLAYKYDNDPDKIEDVIDKDKAMEDVEKFERPATIMNRIAKGYSEDEIKTLADYFAAKNTVMRKQDIDAEKARKGAKLHDKYCEKCHEDGGKVVEDDTGLLAGQWAAYLRYTMHDYTSGAREMPKKMRSKVEDLIEKAGEGAIEDLVHYYASQGK